MQLGPFNQMTSTSTTAWAIVCALVAQHLSSTFPGHVDVISEAVCWALLAVLPARLAYCPSKFDLSSVHHHHHHPPSVSPSEPSFWGPGVSAWIVALGISIASCFKAEIGPIGLFPALTPLVLIVERYYHSWDRHSQSKSAVSASHPLVCSRFCSVLVAFCSILALLDGNVVRTALSAVPTACLFVVFTAFIPRASSSNAYLKFLPAIGYLHVTLGPLAVRVVILLAAVWGVQVFMFGFPYEFSIIGVLALGLLKAGSWCFVIHTVSPCSPSYSHRRRGSNSDAHTTQPQPISWTIATLIATFSLVATCDPSIQSSNFQALSQVILSSVLLWQLIHTFPNKAKTKSALWAFLLVPVVPYLFDLHAVRSLSAALPPWTSALLHPADSLIQQARADFDQLLKLQSKTYRDAVSEYKRRYGIPPPSGFDKWHEFAIANDSPLIDEFDTIFDKISPFLRLSGKKVNMVMDKLRFTDKIELWYCSFTKRGDIPKTQCIHPHRAFDRHISTTFDKMIEHLNGTELPEVKFLVNHYDEPRVMFPPHSHDLSIQDTRLSHQPTWSALTQHCSDPNRTLPSWPKYTSINTHSLPFVTDRVSDLDICQHPEYQTMHGLLLSPTSFNLISGLAPVLSTGAPLTMGDILIPSPAYSESEFQYHPSFDVPWSQKLNNLYWAGSTTGGYASSDSDSYLSFQRQRFVAKAQNLRRLNGTRQQHTYLSSSSDPPTITPIHSPTLNARHYSVAFTRIFGCSPSACRSQRSYFRTKSHAPPTRPFRSKLVFDLDGNGISGRYYALLASSSLPFKQTVLREWHDDRLRPWVHYVPVSLGMEELPELVRWFLGGGERGRKRAEEVARWGKEWMTTAMREVDRSVYLYRLLLELARVGDEEREAMDF